MKRIFILAISTGLLLSSCGGGETTEPKQENSPAAVEATTEEVAEDNSRTETMVVVIEANDQMKYNIDRIDAYVGQKVQLTLKNVGVQPKEAMGHNWTLLQKGIDLQEFAMAAMVDKDNEYLPADRMTDVYAHTSLLGPGEEETIEFIAPDQAGPYKFLCTFPGHFGTMQGIFFVKE
jgi:azurin